MSEDQVWQILAEINQILHPARITAEMDGGKVLFKSARNDICASEELDYVTEAVRIARSAILEPPTAAFTKGYYEHFLAWPSMAARLPGRMERDQEILTSQDGLLRCSISRPSLGFCLAVLRQSHTQSLRSLMGPRMLRRSPEGENNSFSETFLSGYTIKVFDDTSRRTHEELSRIAESSLFNYAFGQSQVLVPTRSWDPLSRRLRHRPRETVQFPRRLYNSDLVAYYQLALSSESALLSYLSLYNVLEYFYSEATEQVLHAKLKDLLVQPDFSHTKVKKLRDLSKIVRTHDQKVNEQLSLRLVIEQKFDLRDIEDWIRSYEQTEEVWFTDRSPLFGEPVPVILSADQLASSLAKRIYHLRCLLVHNKEAEGSKYLPFSEDDDIIRRELPLMIFLAEQLIVSTGRDL